MTVKFNFDYVLHLHNINSYISAIERDGVDEEKAYQNSLVQVNRMNIKSINKSTDGGAIIIMKTDVPPLKTIEEYDVVIDTIQRANTALDIMQKEKVYLFDGFDVDTDELGIVEGWYEKKPTTKKKKK